MSTPTAEARPAGKGLILGGAALLALVLGGGFLAFRGTSPEKKLAVPAPPSGSAAIAPAAVSSAPPAPACPPGMVSIPGGEFYMGLDSAIASPSEKPQHQVTLKPFCIDITEVTVAAYKACTTAGRCPRAPEAVSWSGISAQEKKVYGPLCNVDDAGHEQHPINCVDWEMAENYCKKQGGRLPSSAEWELAVRGPDGRVFPWGDEKPDAKHLNACGKECVAWGKANGEKLTAMHDEDDGFPNTAPVGSFPAGRSRYGLDDVIGNVMEWVQDWDGPYTKSAKTDPTGPAKGKERIIRGGAWNAGDMIWVRPSFRYSSTPDTRSHGIGFRCAKDIR